MAASEADPQPAHAATLTARAEALFCELIEVDAAQRTVQLEVRCGDDRALRDAVAQLLGHYDDPPAILRNLTSEPTPPPPGATTRIGSYTILETIGRGGMGIVYRARQDKPNRIVALKVLSPTLVDAESVARFDREIEVLGLLQHPGICRIHDAGSVDLGLGLGQVLYFAMEFVDGLPLGRFAHHDKLDRRARCALLAQVCDAVQHAHERGIVHRDLKPNNILVAATPQGPQSKVLDFGIARTLAPELAAQGVATRTGSLLGTPQYMSPEQLEGGPSSADARSDVYALGVMLYELLAGQPPLELSTGSLADVCRIVREREPQPLGRVDPALRGDLQVIAAKALAKSREERYASAAELGEDLRRHLRGEPILAQAQTTWRQLQRFARRHRALVGGTLAAVASLMLGLIGVSILAQQNRALAHREAEARGQAETTSERLRRALYGAQMRLDSSAFTFPGGVAQARNNLPRWLPEGDAVDLRGFEWDLLNALCHEAAVVQPCEPRPFQLQWLESGQRLFASHWSAGVLLDAATGTALARYPIEASPLGHAVMSDDGQTLVLSLSNTVLAKLDPVTREPRMRFEHDDEIVRVALSRDGAHLAASVLPGKVVVWDVRTGERLAQMPAQHSLGSAFSRDGAQLAMHSDFGTVQIWRLGAWQEPHRLLQVPEEYVMDLVFAPAGDALATVSREGWLRVHHLTDQTAGRAWRPGGELRRVAFSPDGGHLAVSSEDYAAYVFDVRHGTTRRLAGHAGIVATIAYSPDGKRLATEGDDHTLRIWDLRAAPTVTTTTVAEAIAVHDCQLAWSRDGARLNVHVGAFTNHGWSPADDTLAPGFTIDNGRVRVRLEHQDQLEVAGNDGAQRVIPVQHCQGIALSRHRPLLAIGATGRVRLFDLASDRPERVVPIVDVCRGLAFTHDGRHVACVDGADRVRVVDAETGLEVAARDFSEGALELDCAPNGDLIAIACVDQTIRLWSPSTGNVVELRGHAAHVQSVAFSPDGTRIASGGKDRSVKIWWTAEGTELLTLPHAHIVTAVAWRPDGRALASLDMSGELKVWDASVRGRR